MKKIVIRSARIAKALDYGFWILCFVFASWSDWKIGVAFLCFDLMRVFESIQKDIERSKRIKWIIPGNKSEVAVKLEVLDSMTLEELEALLAKKNAEKEGVDGPTR